MAFIDELDAENVNYEQKLDGLPLVTPEARSGVGVIITSCIEVSVSLLARIPDCGRP